MAKLVLLSDLPFQTNEQLNQRILELLGRDKPSIGYIPSCSDPERKYFEHIVRYYNQLGIENIHYYDLDLEYDSSTFEQILEADAIHLSGGNTFYFLHLLQRRNVQDLLLSYVQKGGMLIGVSAGSILTTPTIEIAGYGKDADENHVGLQDKRALGLVDFEFAPHWDGEEDSLDSLRSYADTIGAEVYACQDGDGIVIDGKVIELYGDVRLIEPRRRGI
ncbi:Type 1 glutamine amidotransferase-like domain-containing protein [Paenibacillus illinoisensis]|uniref:Type 1 glutamine amidotransferase-like domain-containing protein n=1 Tax=Paenibacillus illinoisensis TaxID=59845 RepID=UPI003D9722DE